MTIPKDLGTPYRDVVTTIPLDVIDELLDKYNSNNYRRISDRLVERKRELMRTDQWYPAACVVRLDRNDNVLDGQHSLTAARLERKPLKCILIRNAPGEAAEGFDTNMKTRTLTDALINRGYPNPTNVAAVLRSLYKWDHGTITEGGGTKAQAPTIRQCLDLAEELTDLNDVVNIGMTVNKKVKMKLSVIGPIIIRTRMIDPESSALFITKLVKGPGQGDDVLVKGDTAIIELRDNMGRQFFARQRRSYVYDLAITVKAWNAWITGRDLKQLSWHSGGASAERFPLLTDADGEPWKFPEVKEQLDREREQSRERAAKASRTYRTKKK